MEITVLPKRELIGIIPDDTISKAELSKMMQQGLVELYPLTSIQKYIDDMKEEAQKKDKESLQPFYKGINDDLDQLQLHVTDGQQYYLRVRSKEEIEKGVKGDEKGHWVTTENGQHIFIDGDGKVNATRESISNAIGSEEKIKKDEKDEKNKPIKIKVEECEKVVEGELCVYSRFTNLNTGVSRHSDSEVYRGQDMINKTILTKEEWQKIPTLHGKKWGDEKVISTEIRKYSEDEDQREEELNKEGWNTKLNRAIRRVAFE